MTKLFYTALLLSALCLAGCGGGEKGEIATLDLEKAIDSPRTFDLSEIARDIEFIPLDGSVPVPEISRWHGIQPAAGGGFLIADDAVALPVQRFDAQGRFVCNVGRIGRGAGETHSMTGVSVNDATGEVYVDGTTEIVALDPAGNEFARADGFFNWGTMWYGDRLLTLPVVPPWEKEVYERDTIPFIDMYDRELKLVGSIYGPNVGPGVTMLGGSFPPVLTYNGERLLVKQGGRSDTLYQYNAGALRAAYYLRLGAYAPPAELFAIEPTGEFTERNYAVDDVWEGSRWLVVSVNNGADEGRSPRRLIFDRRDTAAGGFSALGPERKPGLFIDGVKFTPSYVRGSRLVGFMQAFDIVDNMEEISDPHLKEIAAGLREESNPVIVVVDLN